MEDLIEQFLQLRMEAKAAPQEMPAEESPTLVHAPLIDLLPTSPPMSPRVGPTAREDAPLAGNLTGIISANSSFEIDEMAQGITILIIMLISFFIFITVAGNSLVIVCFIEDKRLRSSSNLFLLNLAICDFFIGAFCIPLYVPYMFNGEWKLGKFLCKLWLVFDNLMCTASAFNVVLISYDRFLAVTMAVAYHTQRQQHYKTVLKMAAVWILSSLVYSPAILLWDYFNSDDSFPEELCLPSYYNSWHFLLVASCFDFLLPLLSISFFNLSIYWNIKIRSKKKREASVFTICSTKEEILQIPYIALEGFIHPDQNGLRLPKIKIAAKPCPHLSSKKTKPNRSQSVSAPPSNIHIIKLSHDKKIAKSLFILVCVFCICWAPYSLLMTIRAACHDYCNASYWYEITFWLLWINSSINPILYPLCHSSFRSAFIKVISKYAQIVK
ncbi:histamine H3 receptor-like [Ranitomeya variabilis]|uniref:histamine H3 receptor-like n=1 Tax=Ranitomeya variabilis TaxID=490064 RepID=UPI004057BBBA